MQREVPRLCETEDDDPFRKSQRHKKPTNSQAEWSGGWDVLTIKPNTFSASEIAGKRITVKTNSLDHLAKILNIKHDFNPTLVLSTPKLGRLGIMHLHLTAPLSHLVSRKYSAAKEAGDLLFSPTTLTVIHAAGIPFQLRYCPALAKKPTRHNEPPKSKKQKPNPFLEPSPSLLITQLPGNTDDQSYVLVLNKYPVIPSHFIIATKIFKRQTDLLEKWDLGATYACLRAWEKDEDQEQAQGGLADTASEFRRKKKLFAFFNCGPHSGASQPHRHIQFLPVEEMDSLPITSDQPSKHSSKNDWTLFTETLTNGRGRGQDYHDLPLTVFTAMLPSRLELSVEYLHKIYLDLYEQAVKTCESYVVAHPEERESIFLSSEEPYEREDVTPPSRISYNLALTTTSIAICPRRSEGARLWADGEGKGSGETLGEGEVALNGTILAGTLMVKVESEWTELREMPEKLEKVLGAVGIPPREKPLGGEGDDGMHGSGGL